MPKHTQKQVDEIEYHGIVFRRYPDSVRWPDRSYYVPNSKHRKRGIGRLHQEIWKEANGPIPDGHHIHHVDGNYLNNKLDNLACVSKEDHHNHYGAAMPEWKRKWLRDRMEQVRESASNWHRSEEGREWHKIIGTLAWEARSDRSLSCEHCKKEYQTRSMHGKERFCSNACKAASRRESGIDNETRFCERCKKSFVCSKYSKQRYCSRSCGSGFHYQRGAMP